MIYNILAPSAELQSTVKQYIVIKSLEGLNRLIFLPNGCNFIVFNRGLIGHTKIHNQEITYDMPKNYSLSVKANRVRKFILDKELSQEEIEFPIILVELTPVGFYKVFNKSASALTSGYLEIPEPMVEEYFNKLYTHKSIQKEIAYLNQSLVSLVNFHNNISLPIEDILDKIIDTHHYEVSVEQLCLEFGCSRSTMERDFKKIIGLTPKNFIYIAKFCKTVLAYIGDECTFKELTYLYSDNSHLNSVFKKFFGVNPSVILKEVANNKMRIHQMQKISN